MRRRLWLSLLALPIGLILTDIALGVFYLDTPKYQGPPVPPFVILESPHLKDWIDHELRAREEGKQSSRAKISFDRELGWTHRPRPQSHEHGGYLAEVNSIGARSQREYAAETPDGVLRLACFGDSFVFGSEVEDGEPWTDQLEAKSDRVEAINFGIPGYGLDQSFLRYRRKIQEVEVDVIVVGLQVGSITRVVSRCRFLEHPYATLLAVKPRFRLVEGDLTLVPLGLESADEFIDLALNGGLLERLSEHEYWKGDDPFPSFSAIARLRAANSAHDRRRYRPLWKQTEAEPYRVLTEVLWRFRDEALANGAKEFLLLVFPSHKDLKARGAEGCQYLKALRLDLTSHGIEVLDFDRRFAPLMTLDRSAMFMKQHFNPKANGLVADEVLEWLEEQPGLLPTDEPSRD